MTIDDPTRLQSAMTRLTSSNADDGDARRGESSIMKIRDAPRAARDRHPFESCERTFRRDPSLFLAVAAGAASVA